MTEQQLRIFLVDDDPVARMIAAEHLADPRYAFTEIESGEAFMASLDHAPDIVLMDVEMPGMNGIATCRALRDAGFEQAQVIFVSARDDLETRLEAYDAGGNDFLVKPYAAGELVQKVRVAAQVLADRQGISRQVQYAHQTAMTAMTFMGEQGIVIGFLRASFGCDTPQAVAGALFNAFFSYGLQCLLEIHGPDGVEFYCSERRCSQLEKSILGHARRMDRIFQFRDRLAINYEHITLLVPNLPLDDPDRIGRLRDHLAIMAEGAEARLTAIDKESQRLAQADGILSAAADLKRMLDGIEERQGANRLRAVEVSSGYLINLEREFVRLGLSETQEEALLGMARGVTESISQLLDDGKGLGDELRQVAGTLATLAKQG